MCVVSWVQDHYEPLFPRPANPAPTITGPSVFTWPPQFTPEEVAALRKLIANYQEAMKAAETIDRLTGQPDCEDPEKAKLKVRVAELEAHIAKLEAQLDAVRGALGAPKVAPAPQSTGVSLLSGGTLTLGGSSSGITITSSGTLS